MLVTSGLPPQSNTQGSLRQQENKNGGGTWVGDAEGLGALMVLTWELGEATEGRREGDRR